MRVFPESKTGAREWEEEPVSTSGVGIAWWVVFLELLVEFVKIEIDFKD